MSAEVVVGVVAKWLWAPFTAWAIWRIQVREKRIKDLELQSTETDKQITELRTDMKVLKETFKVFLEKQDIMREDIGIIKTTTAVTQNDIKHLKEGK